MNQPFFDVLGVVAGLIDIGVNLFSAVINPTVSVFGYVFAFLSAVLNSIFLFGGGM